MKQAVFRSLMLRDLVELLGCASAAVPPAFLSDEPRPLKIGTNEELLARFPGADQAKVSRWLRLWTSRLNYIKAVAYGLLRFDLDDKPAGEISADEKKHARKQIAANRKPQKAPPPPKPRRTVGQNGRPILSLLPGLRRAAP